MATNLIQKPSPKPELVAKPKDGDWSRPAGMAIPDQAPGRELFRLPVGSEVGTSGQSPRPHKKGC
jgi:hypothetical protein